MLDSTPKSTISTEEQQESPKIRDRSGYSNGDFTLISSDNLRFRVASVTLMAAR